MTVDPPPVPALSDEDRALIERLPPGARAVNAIPDADIVAARGRAYDRTRAVLGPVLRSGGLRVSPLGPGWSRDIDAHVRRRPDPETLRTAGWVILDPLLERLGSPGTGRWGILDGGRLLAVVDIDGGQPPDPVTAVLRRMHRRREVRLREVLELRHLKRSGQLLPTVDPLVALAADAERSLGGRELEAWATGRPTSLPASLPPSPSGRLRRWWWRVRAHRFVVALSGIDGSGKSTVADRLAREFSAIGIDVSRVWVRPGMDLGLLHRAAVLAKRVVGMRGSAEVLRTEERGSDDPPPSRRGILGWCWAMAIVLSFVMRARREHRRARGLVIYDRHIPDAIATLEVVYGGEVDLRVHRWLVRTLVPSADVTIHLDLDPAVAGDRKPVDMFGVRARDRQRAVYASEPDRDRWTVIDAARPLEAVCEAAIRAVTSGATVTGPQGAEPDGRHL